MIFAESFIGLASGSVEAMRADAAFRHADACDEVVKVAEFQCRQTQAARYFFHHALILRRARCGIKLEIGFVITLKIFDNLTGNQLHVAF